MMMFKKGNTFLCLWLGLKMVFLGMALGVTGAPANRVVHDRAVDDPRPGELVSSCCFSMVCYSCCPLFESPLS